MFTNKGFDLPKTEALCRIAEPLTWNEEKSQLMVDSCREMAVFHQKNCPELSFLYKREHFDPASLVEQKDLLRLPSLSVHAMKYHLVTSLAHELAVLKMTSSGTSGQKTQIWMDQESLDRGQAMLASLWQQEGLVSDKPTNYLMFVYDPKDADDLGIAYSASNRQRFAPPRESVYAIKKNKQGEWEFKKEMAIAELRRFAKEPHPVRVLGITAFIHDLLLELKEKGGVSLPAGSFMFTTGGWKAAEAKKVTRDEFQKTASEVLGLDLSNVRDGYGMAEHGAPYWQCRHHRFHVPVYTRVIVRDPVTMREKPAGEVGLMQLITPFNSMMPTLSLLTTDLGVVDDTSCPCGKNSPTFRLLGRGGISKHKGCAIHASEIIRRGK